LDQLLDDLGSMAHCSPSVAREKMEKVYFYWIQWLNLGPHAVQTQPRRHLGF
jgi:hypothetical protein